MLKMSAPFAPRLHIARVWSPTTTLSVTGVWEVEVWRDDFAGLGAADHRDNLDRSAGAPPLKDPLLKEAEVIALHELKTPRKVGFNPAIYVL
jgi:hypothetical protein